MILLTLRGPNDWECRLANPVHWKRRHGAMEVAMAWEGASGRPDETAALFPDARLIQAIVEYPFTLPVGGGFSFTDVIALIAGRERLTAVTVEAKCDEFVSPTLGEWRKDASSGKANRLTVLCDFPGLDQCPTAGRQSFRKSRNGMVSCHQIAPSSFSSFRCSS